MIDAQHTHQTAMLGKRSALLLTEQEIFWLIGGHGIAIAALKAEPERMAQWAARLRQTVEHKNLKANDLVCLGELMMQAHTLLKQSTP